MKTVPRLCEFYPVICLTTEEKARKNLSQSVYIYIYIYVNGRIDLQLLGCWDCEFEFLRGHFRFLCLLLTAQVAACALS
jgi:hypothetical protein